MPVIPATSSKAEPRSPRSAENANESASAKFYIIHKIDKGVLIC